MLTLLSAGLSLALTEPAASRAIVDIVGGSADPAVLGQLAPLLVRIDAPGLPPAVALAVQENDLQRAGELLSNSMLLFKIGDDEQPVAPGSVPIHLTHLLPPPLRWLSTFGAAAAYFTIFTAAAGKRRPGNYCSVFAC